MAIAVLGKEVQSGGVLLQCAVPDWCSAAHNREQPRLWLVSAAQGLHYLTWLLHKDCR